MKNTKDDILPKLRSAWNEDHKMNLMHYCDLAANEIEQLRAALREISKCVGVALSKATEGGS